MGMLMESIFVSIIGAAEGVSTLLRWWMWLVNAVVVAGSVMVILSQPETRESINPRVMLHGLEKEGEVDDDKKEGNGAIVGRG